MSRPAPQVLRNRFEEHSEVEILESLGFWIVTYQGKAFGLRHYMPRSACIYKYPRLGFANQAHAHRLAAKLNADFNCNDFGVLKVA